MLCFANVTRVYSLCVFFFFFFCCSVLIHRLGFKITLSKEQSFFFSMMWIYIAVVLLWMGLRGHAESQLVQFSPAEFYHKLDTGKIMLVFFQRQGLSLVFAGKFLCNQLFFKQEFVLQATILTDKILFLLFTSMSNSLSVLGGAGKVCCGSARLRNTSWKGNHRHLRDCNCNV